MGSRVGGDDNQYLLKLDTKTLPLILYKNYICLKGENQLLVYVVDLIIKNKTKPLKLFFSKNYCMDFFSVQLLYLFFHPNNTMERMDLF